MHDGIIGHFAPDFGRVRVKLSDSGQGPRFILRFLCPGVHVSALILASFSTGQRRVALRRKGWRPHAGPCYTALQTGPITLTDS